MSDIIVYSTIPLKLGLKRIKACQQKHTFDGVRVRTTSQRLKTFQQGGTDCVRCDAKGFEWRVERHKNMPEWSNPSLSLYARRKDGTVVLMTSDHKIPKSRGGPNASWNRQPMCCLCNVDKGHEKLTAYERFLQRTYANMINDEWYHVFELEEKVLFNDPIIEVDPNLPSH